MGGARIFLKLFFVSGIPVIFFCETFLKFFYQQGRKRLPSSLPSLKTPKTPPSIPSSLHPESGYFPAPDCRETSIGAPFRWKGSPVRSKTPGVFAIKGGWKVSDNFRIQVFSGYFARPERYPIPGSIWAPIAFFRIQILISHRARVNIFEKYRLKCLFSKTERFKPNKICKK